MKKYAVMLALVLTGTIVLVQPSVAEATGARVSVTKPSAVREGAVVAVRGRVKGPVKSVRIQKRVNGKWVTARDSSMVWVASSVLQSCSPNSLNVTAASSWRIR